MIPLAFFGVRDLPVVNATLNGIATVLLIAGFFAIRQRKVQRHRAIMISAFATSCVFLVCYLVYHYNVGSVKFDKPGWVRTVYLWILATHTVLAAAVPVLAILTLRSALVVKFTRHRALAKRWR